MKLKSLVWSGLFGIVFSLSAMANMVTITTPSGSTDTAGDPVNAEAIVTTGTGTVTVQLVNLLSAAAVNDVGQNLSDFSFALSGTFMSGLVTNASEGTPTGTLIDVGSGGTVTSDTTDAVGKWTFSNTGSTFLLEDLGGPVGPAQTIIGGTAGSFTAYSAANGSIMSGPHQPLVQGEETFTLSILGVTSATNITAGTFSFGTTTGDNIPGRMPPVPEPRTTVVMLLGGLAMVFAFRRRKAVSA